MLLKAGMAVKRKEEYIRGQWGNLCAKKGIDPRKVFIIDRLGFGSPVFECLSDGAWAAGRFYMASVPDKPLEDYL